MPRKGFHLDTILLITLLLHIAASCLISITCPCGTGENLVNFTLCINNTLDENSTCKEWANCETCESNSTKCLTCPKDRYGPSCSETKLRIRICPDPGTPEGASRENTNGTEESETRFFLEGETLYYYCDDENYSIEGAYVINCTSSGNWSDALPTCEKIDENEEKVTCLDPGTPESGGRKNATGFNVTEGKEFLEGENLYFFCNNEDLILKGYPFATCNSLGLWSHPLPFCAREEKVVEEEKEICLDIGMPEGGYRKNAAGINEDEERDFLEGDTLYFYCYDEDSILEGNPFTTCTSFGFWSNPPPRCVNVERAGYCIDPGPIENGRVTSDFNIGPASNRNRGQDLYIQNPSIPPFYPMSYYQEDKYTVGRVLKYECFNGYRLEGNRFLTCSLTGRWFGDKPICVQVSIDPGFNFWFRHTQNYHRQRHNLPDLFVR